MEIRLKLDRDSDNSSPSEPLSISVLRGRAFITLENPRREIGVDAWELFVSLGLLVARDQKKEQK